MAAATLLDGPDVRGFLGQFSGIRIQCGRAKFADTATTCTIPLKGAGLGLVVKPMVFTQNETAAAVADILVPSFSGSTLTLTRTRTVSADTFAYLIAFGG